MKIKLLLCLVPFVFTGCVGYNTVLFTTKSNAGLDFDTKPPTAEINISRKEGVVEPVFEGGKTPPVMASFSSQIGSGGGVGRFFFGVDQTFAGGDAAVTMAKLYDNNERIDETPSNVTRFDSGLPLSKLPDANVKRGWLGLKKFFFGLPEPGEVRPFFFGTDSQLGVKVAWNGVGGPYPDTIKIGYNRKEMALAPVTLSNNIIRIPSFLATVDTSTQGSNNVGVNWMQYFATGDSASFLARQYGVRQAMLKRADPKAAAESAAEKAGAQQHEKVVNQAAEMVKWATGVDGKLLPANIDTLVHGTELEASKAQIKVMAPADFQKKLNGTWSLFVFKLWANFPNKPE